MIFVWSGSFCFPKCNAEAEWTDNYTLDKPWELAEVVAGTVSLLSWCSVGLGASFSLF